MRNSIRNFLLIFVAAMMGPGTALAQTKSRIPDRSLYDAMFNAAKPTGLVQFRNWNGRQLVYFTPLQTLHCRLREIRFSVNSDALDQNFPVADCNPQNPLALPSGSGLDDIALSLEPGSAQTVAVQVIWDDGSESAVSVYEPCKDVGEQTCAWPLQ